MNLRALALISMLLPAATLADELVWTGGNHEEGAWLAYAIPESDYMPIAFYCEADSGSAMLSYQFEPLDAVDGVEVELLLTAGDIEIPIGMTGSRSEMDDLFIVYGSTPIDDRFSDLLMSLGMLSVFVEDGVHEYGLEGARPFVASFVEACGTE